MIPNAYFDRFETKKYRAKNPVQRRLIRRFVGALHDMFLEANPARSICEIGVGEGFLSGYLSEKFPEKTFTGLDLSEQDLARAGRLFPRLKLVRGSAYDLSVLEGSYDVVLCAEVLEHLREPDRALAEISRLRPRHAIFSVPHEPYFMLSNLARLKNVTRLGNDPEHVGHYGPRGFERLLSKRFEVQRIEKSFPWLLALCTPR